MRSGAGFAAAPAAACGPHGAGGHSPVSYLFGGLAAMMGLIAFALLILACSYWKLSGYLDGGGDDGREEGKPRDNDSRHTTGCDGEQPVVVIMAGQEKPTYLATAVAGRASAGDCVAADGEREGE